MTIKYAVKGVSIRKDTSDRSWIKFERLSVYIRWGLQLTDFRVADHVEHLPVIVIDTFDTPEKYRGKGQLGRFLDELEKICYDEEFVAIRSGYLMNERLPAFFEKRGYRLYTRPGLLVDRIPIYEKIIRYP